ncbi:MAG: hypothetical protein Kow0031_40390 [Anaerolineae bacterium]
MSCIRSSGRVAAGAVQNGLSRLGNRRAFYAATGLAAGIGLAVLGRRRRAVSSGGGVPIGLQTLLSPGRVNPLRAEDAAGRTCARCGAAGSTQKGHWYLIGGLPYCQDCAPAQAQHSGVTLSADALDEPPLQLSALTAWWPRRPTTLQPVTVASGGVSGLAGYAVLIGGKPSGLSLMPEVRADQGQLRVDERRWFVNYDRAHKALAGPFSSREQAQTAASLLCNFNWNRDVVDFSAEEVASVKALLIEFRKKLKEE